MMILNSFEILINFEVFIAVEIFLFQDFCGNFVQIFWLSLKQTSQLS